MEEHIISAIQIALDPKAPQDLKGPAFEYVNNLRQEPRAWQPCLSVSMHLPRHEQVVRVFCLEVVSNAVRAGIIDQQGLVLVKDQFLDYLRKEYNSKLTAEPPDNYSVENKIAQTTTYLFCALYDTAWPTCLDDLRALCVNESGQYDNLIGVAFYLRILNSIHDEIGDQLVARSKEEQSRASVLKDLVRSKDARKIAQSWQDILSYWQLQQGTVGELTMQSIAKFVSWIDISLVVNPQMLPLISQQVDQKQVQGLAYKEERARDTAVESYEAIVTKKMSPRDKLDMIDFIGVLATVSKMSTWSILHDTGKSIYDVDLAEIVARLLNSVVLEIVRILETEQKSTDVWRKAEQMLRSFLPLLLRYFADEYDDVCSHVVQAMNELLSFLRKTYQGDEFVSQRATLLVPILQAILLKSRIDDMHLDGFDVTATGDYEEAADFNELRKRLSNLQSTIAATDEQLYIDAVADLVHDTFRTLRERGRYLNWRDLDLGLHELYLLGDLVVKTPGGIYQKNKPTAPVAERFIQAMVLMVQSNFADYTHPGNQVQYMEICVRYHQFFEKHPEYVQPVLQNFLQLAHNPLLRVRMRAWYLLQRFVRQERHNVGPVADAVVPNLLDLLVIEAELPTGSGDESSDDGENANNAFTSQLYLFETIGCILSTSNVPVDKQIQYAQMVMQPMFTDVQKNLGHAQSNKLACLQVHHLIMAFGNTAKGYVDASGSNTIQAVNNIPGPVKDAFSQVAEVTLIALETLKKSDDIRTAARFTFARLLAMVGQQMLPQLPRWVEAFLVESSSRDEVAQLLRLLDQVTFAFKSDVHNFLDALFGGLLQRVWAGISTPAAGTDDEVEMAELKREYLNFMLVVLGNGLGSILVSTTNQSHFETVIESIEHFTKDISDPTTAKMAFQLLARMCMVWGGSDAVANQIPSDMTQPGQQELPGFKLFMMTRFSPLVWAMPANPNFNSKDGQSRLVLMDGGNLQKTIYAKNGDEYIKYLRNTELPNLGLQGPMLEDFFKQLKTLDMKSWRSWFAKFVTSGGMV